MAHYHFTYFKDNDIVASWYSTNFDTFNHAYDCALFFANFGHRLYKDFRMTKADDRIETTYTDKGRKCRCVLEVYATSR